LITNFALNFKKVLLSLSLITAFLLSNPAYSAKKWEGSVPKLAQKQENWIELTNWLYSKKYFYGALASAKRMLIFFDDVKTKEYAYRTLIALIDKGYPFSVRKQFVTGDLETDPEEDYIFNSTYNLYKGILNESKGMKKWADYYFAKVDKEKFPKYLYFQAISHYTKKEFDQAEELLKKILAIPLSRDQESFVKKVSRTLARIYFEKKEYKKSYEIYRVFLLKTNPITTSDWLEAAWNLYYLEKPREAMGVLYNLMPKVLGMNAHLEKYVIRALIYRDLCEMEAMEELIKNFEKDYGESIKHIKDGKNLKKLGKGWLIHKPQDTNYYESGWVYSKLKEEFKEIAKFPEKHQELAKYLYSSEAKALGKVAGFYREKALKLAAKNLIILSENLKFLKFELERERFNPDVVFLERTTGTEEPLVEYLNNDKFRLKWYQTGSFWRDERPSYKAIIKGKCGT
jgi:tetratricopeptide (TPR) repeat protein